MSSKELKFSFLNNNRRLLFKDVCIDTFEYFLFPNIEWKLYVQRNSTTNSWTCSDVIRFKIEAIDPVIGITQTLQDLSSQLE